METYYRSSVLKVKSMSTQDNVDKWAIGDGANKHQ